MAPSCPAAGDAGSGLPWSIRYICSCTHAMARLGISSCPARKRNRGPLRHSGQGSDGGGGGATSAALVTTRRRTELRARRHSQKYAMTAETCTAAGQTRRQFTAAGAMRFFNKQMSPRLQVHPAPHGHYVWRRHALMQWHGGARCDLMKTCAAVASVHRGCRQQLGCRASCVAHLG